MSKFDIIAQAIGYINSHPKRIIPLEELAINAGMSSSHFQKTFTEWAGVSPKQFQRYLTLEFAKISLKKGQNNLKTSIDTGLTGTGRLHDLFVDIEAMTPREYGSGGENLTVSYSVQDSDFGRYLVASTEIGVCLVVFIDSSNPLDLLRERFPKAKFISRQTDLQQPVIQYFAHTKPLTKIKLHLYGTNYQLQVWRALLSIPEGQITSYGKIATTLGDSSGIASRAVGTAVGKNPIACIIPCHRVLKSTGQISGYRWGVVRKQAILGKEFSM
jgi:AraC family transcriptional regulator, regulatory protein of adaptative response / methylated-DNA-[protein]-cysteine methyltransferase